MNPNEVSFNFLSCLVMNLHVQAKNLVEYRLKFGEILRFVSLAQNDEMIFAPRDSSIVLRTPSE